MFNNCRINKQAQIVKDNVADGVNFFHISISSLYLQNNSQRFLEMFPGFVKFLMFTVNMLSHETVRSNSRWKVRRTSHTEADRMLFIKHEKHTGKKHLNVLYLLPNVLEGNSDLKFAGPTNKLSRSTFSSRNNS